MTNEDLGVEHPFLGKYEKAFTGLAKNIPKLADVPNAAQNPLNYYSKTKSIIAAGTYDFEAIPNKIWYINHIFCNVDSVSGDTYHILIADRTQEIFLTYTSIKNQDRIDIDYSTPIVFKDRIGFTFIPSGGGGDVCVITLVGYVQNK